MMKVVAGALLAGVAVAALLAGAGPLAAVVIVVAGIALVDACLLLGRAGPRPVLVVAALPGVVLPLVVAFDTEAGWGRIPLAFAIALLSGFVLLLLFGRRRGVVLGLGSTILAALVVGLGASSVVLLRALPDGFRWLLALFVLVVGADLAAPLVALVRQRRATGSEDDTDEQALTAPLDAVLPGVLVVAAVGAALALLLTPPLTWVTAALLAVVALVSALGGSYLHRALSLEGGIRVVDRRTPVRGSFLGLVDAVLLAAPATYVIARAAVL